MKFTPGFKKIKLSNYEVQPRIVQVLFVFIILTWCGNVYMMGYNRYIYSLKRVETNIIRSNLSTNKVQRVIAESGDLKGEDILIEKYILQYIKLRESYTPISSGSSIIIRYFSSNRVYSEYKKFIDNIFSKKHIKKESFLRLATIDKRKVKRTDDGSYQIHFTVIEKTKPTAKEYISKKIVFVRYEFFSDDEFKRFFVDNKKGREDAVSLINPLKIKIITYNTSSYVQM